MEVGNHRKISSAFQNVQKNHPRKLEAVLDNLQRFVDLINLGISPLQVKGFIHKEPDGIRAIDQKGGHGQGLAATRLYIYCDTKRTSFIFSVLVESRGRTRIFSIEKKRPAKSKRRDKMGKQYTSVGQMVNDLADESFAKAFAERSAKTELSRTLFVLRNRAGLTECEVGDRLGWSQSAVSKFEREEIDNIKFGDLERYLNALDMQMRISFFEKGNTIVDQVKRHVFETKHLLDRLAIMGGEDEKIAREVSKFFAEYFVNVNNFYFSSASRLPRPEVAFDLTMKYFDEYLEKVLLPILAEAEVADGEGAEDAPPKAFRNISLITS